MEENHMINHMMRGSQGEHSIITGSQRRTSKWSITWWEDQRENIVLSLVHMEEHHMINTQGEHSIITGSHGGTSYDQSHTFTFTGILW